MIKTIIIIIFLCSSVFSQFNEPLQLKLKENSESVNKKNSVKINPYKKNELPVGSLLAALPFVLINPVLVFEDHKIFWGLTKEISFSSLHFGRASFEYSFLFRTFNKNHLRFSYNYDFLYQQGSTWLYYAISPGAGYFTDTQNKGAFAQLSTGFLLPTPVIFFHFYIKYRFTKIFNENKSDIHDISLGAGFVF
jgi:hypothetical protein